jgi:putative aldouronate transport system permease protein
MSPFTLVGIKIIIGTVKQSQREEVAMMLRLHGRTKSRSFLYELNKNKALFIMLIPVLIVLIINNYLPMFGIILAFKDFKMSSGNFVTSLFSSEWVGFKNFEFFLKTSYGFSITRNTILFNGLFIILTLLTAVPTAIMLNELKNRKLAKFYQTAMFLPQFMSWVVVSFLAFAFFSVDVGFINKFIVEPLGFEAIQWYSEPKYWLTILPLVTIWKTLGFNTIIYFAGISSIDTELYEAAVIDGANKWKQAINITVPLLTPLMIILTLLSIGRIFFADFGLFFQVTQNSGALYPVTLVIDTYVFNALRVMGDPSMSTAVGLYQAVVGLVLVLGANLIVKKINKDHVLF